MSSQTFNASAGFHVANAGIDRTVSSSEEICGEEKGRIRTANAPTVTLLQCRRGVLLRERLYLQAALDAAPHVAAQPAAWPVWQTIMAMVFVLAGLGFTRMSFEPFGLNPELLWLSSVGIACLCSYATAELLERTGLQVLVLAISATLFVLSLTGLAMLASVRGDLFALHLQNIPNAGDVGAAAAPENALAFYRAAAPKMRLFLTFLSLSLELAGGLALHQVRVALKGRKPPVPRESGRLELVEQEIGAIEAQLISLLNEPEVFEHEYRRNLAIGLLTGVARHTAAARKGWMTVALLVAVGSGSMLCSQSVAVVEALDYSATSKATNYGGRAAHTENIDAAARIIECLPQGSRLTVSAISDQSFARPFVLLTGKIPDTAGPYREYDQIAATRRRLAADLRRIGATSAPNFPSTDILGFLMAQGIAFANSPRMRHVLVVYSDMRQSARPLDIEHVPAVPLGAALATVAREHLFADLTGVEIYIYGVHAVGKDVRYWQSLRDFWAAYFERCHANLRAFSMTRENPDLGGSR
jgi:hypothetical protein